jgi:enamine deaminase RidA (YjgF/YER057c/UK114 family)
MIIKKYNYKNYNKMYITLDMYNKSILECFDSLINIYDYIKANNIIMIYENYYGKLETSSEILKVRNQLLLERNIDKPPFKYLIGNSCNNSSMAGINIMGISSNDSRIQVDRIHDNDIIIGSVLRNYDEDELYLIGVTSVTESKNILGLELERVYNKVGQIIKQYGFSINDIYRTFFYLKNLLDDYETFNQCRDSFFRKKYSNKHFFPSSTCIQGHSIYNDSVIIDVFAKKIFSSSILNEIYTSKQCSAIEYNKLFSRGVLIKENKNIRAFISGTASINNYGETEFLDNSYKQIEYTLECVNELLKNVNLNFNDVSIAQIYIKRKEDYNIFLEVKDLRKVNFPFVCMIADVCRDDLLFEIDLIAEKEAF